MADTDSMILIGGELSSGVVTGEVGRYDKNGKLENLPSLLYPRHSHGCAGYRNSLDQLVSVLSAC